MCFTVMFGVLNVRVGLTFSKMFVVRDEERFPGHLAFTRGHLGGHTERSAGEIVEEGCLTTVLSSVSYLHLCWCVCACARVPAGTHLVHCIRPFIQPSVETLFPASSVQFSCSVMSHSLPPHGLQHARPPCPSPTPGACSCPSSR